MSVEALLDESVLAARAKVDPSAFADIYDHYFPRVYNYVRYRVRDADAADDITAEIFERALINVGDYRPERASFANWLFAIARNAVRDHIRGRKRRRLIPLETLSDQPSPDPQPDEVAIRSDAHKRLQAAVASLNDREQELIALKFAAGLTNRSIAKLCGLSESNVAVILYRAVGRVRSRLCDTEEDL